MTDIMVTILYCIDIGTLQISYYDSMRIRLASYVYRVRRNFPLKSSMEVGPNSPNMFFFGIHLDR